MLADRGPSTIEDSRVAPIGCSISIVGVTVASIRCPLPLVRLTFPPARRGIAYVRQPFALVGFPFALVGHTFAFARVLRPIHPSLPAVSGGKHPPISGLSTQDGVPDSAVHDSPAFGVGLAAQPQSDHAMVGGFSIDPGELSPVQPNLFGHGSALLIAGSEFTVDSQSRLVTTRP